MSPYAENAQKTINDIDARQDSGLSRIKAAYQRIVKLLQDQRDATIQLVADLTAQVELTTEARNLLDNFVATIQANTAEAETEANSQESTATGEENTGVVGAPTSAEEESPAEAQSKPQSKSPAQPAESAEPTVEN